ncbi:MAG TPA: glutamine-synthetase adenylyltransferase, partial [Novosphingobium sp.]|nr:glutamine-synthetase adenylyltransferase [Novosphingobium sp.]
VHFLQLRHATCFVPHLGDAVRALAGAGLVSASLITAHDTLARALVAARLLAPDSQEPPQAAKAVLARACGADDWHGLLASLAQARATVASAWTSAFGEKLETGS